MPVLVVFDYFATRRDNEKATSVNRCSPKGMDFEQRKVNCQLFDFMWDKDG